MELGFDSFYSTYAPDYYLYYKEDCSASMKLKRDLDSVDRALYTWRIVDPAKLSV